eukprot:3941128-Alexandrium_andersonii.AAC.1
MQTWRHGEAIQSNAPKRTAHATQTHPRTRHHTRHGEAHAHTGTPTRTRQHTRQWEAEAPRQAPRLGAARPGKGLAIPPG